MKRILLTALKVSHYDVLLQIETRCYDRLEYLSRSIDDLKGQILELERLHAYETADLKSSQDEIREVLEETRQIETAMANKGDSWTCVELIQDTLTGLEYYTIQYGDGFYSFGYSHSGTFHVSPDEFLTHCDAIKAIEKRELSLSLGETLMF